VGLALGFALLALRRFGAAPRWWQLLPLLGALALVVVLDLRLRIIPDIITLPGLAYALGLAAVSSRNPTVVEAGLGALVGGGLVLLVAIVSAAAWAGATSS
jgi:prepilin signal peptidase PulO-like enzyme (type II secretory pathway)